MVHTQYSISSRWIYATDVSKQPYKNPLYLLWWNCHIKAFERFQSIFSLFFSFSALIWITVFLLRFFFFLVCCSSLHLFCWMWLNATIHAHSHENEQKHVWYLCSSLPNTGAHARSEGGKEQTTEIMEFHFRSTSAKCSLFRIF